MGIKEIKITIDSNGNIQRKVSDKPQAEVKKPKIIKRVLSALTAAS